MKLIIIAKVFFCLSLYSNFCFSQTQELDAQKALEKRIQTLSNAPYWLKLGHYRLKSKKKYKGEVDGPNFYLAENGRYHPMHELKATFEGIENSLKKNAAEEQSIICRFPLRYKWLIDQKLFVHENDFDFSKHCPRFTAWFKRMNAKAAVLVFAGSYLNNPSSMFGHTFLRFKKRSSLDESNALLDNVVNFAANTGNEGGMLYTVKGLLGGYPGVFSTFPYHLKINEYVNLEARDLWEYHLSLSQDNVDILLFHLWELSKTYFDYYFIDENCSYFLLSLLEINDPDFSLVEKLPFFTTPVDTVKVLLKHTQWVNKIKLRPSYRRIYQARLKKLNKKSKKTAYKMIKTKQIADLSNYKKEQQKNIMDAVIDYEKYSNRKMVPSDYEKSLWLERSKLPASDSIDFSSENDPASSHPTMRIGFGASYRQDSVWLANVYFRGAYHDQLNSQKGLNNLSHIEAMNGKITFNSESKKLLIPELSIVNIISLSPLSILSKKPSWNIKLSIEESFTEECLSCRQAQLSFGPGITLGSNTLGTNDNRRFLIYSFLNSVNALSLSKKLSSFVGLETDTGFLFDLGGFASQKLGFKYGFNALDRFSTQEQVYFQQAFHLSRKNELRIDLKHNLSDYDIAFYYLRYF